MLRFRENFAYFGAILWPTYVNTRKCAHKIPSAQQIHLDYSFELLIILPIILWDHNVPSENQTEFWDSNTRTPSNGQNIQMNGFNI